MVIGFSHFCVLVSMLEDSLETTFGDLRHRGRFKHRYKYDTFVRYRDRPIATFVDGRQFDQLITRGSKVTRSDFFLEEFFQ